MGLEIGSDSIQQNLSKSVVLSSYYSFTDVFRLLALLVHTKHLWHLKPSKTASFAFSGLGSLMAPKLPNARDVAFLVGP